VGHVVGPDSVPKLCCAVCAEEKLDRYVTLIRLVAESLGPTTISGLKGIDFNGTGRSSIGVEHHNSKQKITDETNRPMNIPANAFASRKADREPVRAGNVLLALA
jgi:hypothetical protein